MDEVSRALNFSRLEALCLRSWLVSFGAEAEPRAPLRPCWRESLPYGRTEQSSDFWLDSAMQSQNDLPVNLLLFLSCCQAFHA